MKQLPTFKDLKLTEYGVLPFPRPLFFGVVGSHLLVVRQPNTKDRTAIRETQSRITERTRTRYSASGLRKSKTRKTIDELPPWRKGQLGILNQIIEVYPDSGDIFKDFSKSKLKQGYIVGFARQLYQKSQSATLINYSFNVPNQIVCENFVSMLDDYQGYGFGTVYGPISTFIAEYNGADWIVGTTYMNHGMFNIRMKEGWEVTKIHRDAPGGDQASIKYRIHKG